MISIIFHFDILCRLSPLIATFCGENVPPTIKSFANQIYLKFESDSSISGKGFEIEWEGTSTGCGGLITSTKV
jgi:cubilin